MRTCRHCGCTDERACPGGCSWVGPDLCSACAAKGGFEVTPDIVGDLAADVLFLRLTGVEAFYLFSALQLACQHPEYESAGGAPGKWVKGFARALQERIALQTPAMSEVMEAGWMPECDESRIIVPGDLA